MDKDMAQLIYDVLMAQMVVLMSWGFQYPRVVADGYGLQFHVNGFVFKGWVRIVYNQGNDLFDIYLLKSKDEIVAAIEGVYISELVRVIDSHVEHCENYNERVMQEYENMQI